MADGTIAAPNLPTEFLGNLKTAAVQELKTTANAAKSQITGQKYTQSPQDKAIQAMEKEEEEYKQKKLAELEVRKKQLINERHKDVQEWDTIMIQREQKEKQEEQHLASEEEKGKVEKKKNELPSLEEPKGKQPQGMMGGVKGKIKRGFSLGIFNRNKSRESKMGQGVGG